VRHSAVTVGAVQNIGGSNHGTSIPTLVIVFQSLASGSNGKALDLIVVGLTSSSCSSILVLETGTGSARWWRSKGSQGSLAELRVH
jgi:hypothetical protein